MFIMVPIHHQNPKMRKSLKLHLYLHLNYYHQGILPHLSLNHCLHSLQLLQCIICFVFFNFLVNFSFFGYYVGICKVSTSLFFGSCTSLSEHSSSATVATTFTFALRCFFCNFGGICGPMNQCRTIFFALSSHFHPYCSGLSCLIAISPHCCQITVVFALFLMLVGENLDQVARTQRTSPFLLIQPHSGLEIAFTLITTIHNCRYELLQIFDFLLAQWLFLLQIM